MTDVSAFNPDYYIKLRSGGRFYLADEQGKHQSSFTLQDIAGSLALQCRFTGHTNGFYSVCEHAVMVSLLVGREYALAGLHHDDAEAFIGDISRPLKRQPFMKSYRDLEESIQRRISGVVGLPATLSLETLRAVAAADNMMCRFELDNLLQAGGPVDVCDNGEKVDMVLHGIRPRGIVQWDSETAEQKYLQIHEALTTYTGFQNIYDTLRDKLVLKS
jgi:hypothetical protein